VTVSFPLSNLRFYIRRSLDLLQLQCQQAKDAGFGVQILISPLAAVVDALDAQTLVAIYALHAILFLYVYSIGALFATVALGSGPLLPYVQHTFSGRCPVACERLLHRSIYGLDANRKVVSMPCTGSVPSAVPADHGVLLRHPLCKYAVGCILKGTPFDSVEDLRNAMLSVMKQMPKRIFRMEYMSGNF
jgi:hypothetical protein